MLLDYLGISTEAFLLTNIADNSSKKYKNKDIICDIPVLQFGENIFGNNKVGIIVAMHPRYFPEVIDYMQSKVKDIDYILYFDTNPIVEITTKIGCSVNCSYCPQNLLIKNYIKRSANDKKLLLDFESFKEYLSAIPPITLIRFCGMSEPFLNESCPDMIEYAYESGYKVDLYSTLIGLKIDDIERVLKCIDNIVLHVPDSAGNADIPITDDYKEKLKKVFAYKRDGEYIIPIISCHGNIHPEITKLIPNDLRYVLWNEMQDRAGNLEVSKKDVFHYNRQGSIICTVNGRNSIILDSNIMLPNGDLLMCCMDYSLDYVIGNLSKNKYEEILQGDCVNRIRQNMLQQKDDILCRHCNLASEISV